MDATREVRLTLVFDDRRISMLVLDRIFRSDDVAVELLRGRLSEESVWFDLKVRGAARGVERVVEFSRPWSVLLPCPEPQLI
jgi:hypothetical protein